MKACDGGRGASYPLGLALAVDTGEWSTSRRGRLSPVPIELDAGWTPKACVSAQKKSSVLHLPVIEWRFVGRPAIRLVTLSNTLQRLPS